MVPHGPDAEAFDKASHADLKPQKLDNTLAFMFESRYRFMPTAFAMQSPRARRRLRRLLGRPQGSLQTMNAMTHTESETATNATHDPELRSWVASANAAGTDFPIQNLPFGRFRPAGSTSALRIGVAIGDQVLDLQRRRPASTPTT